MGRLNVLRLEIGDDDQPTLLFLDHLDGLAQPMDVAVHDGGTPSDPTDDRVLVAEAALHRVSVFGLTGDHPVRRFEFGTLSWERMTDGPGQQGLGDPSVYDPQTQHVFRRANSRMLEYDPVADTFSDLAESNGVAVDHLRQVVYQEVGQNAVLHLFRVAGSLDSLVVGEGQIAGQAKQAYDLAQQAGTVGPVLHALFQHARIVAKRVRTETALGEGATAFVPAVEFRSEKQVGRSRSRAFQLSAQRLRRHRHQKSSRMALTMRLATSRARRSIPGPPSSKYAI